MRRRAWLLAPAATLAFIAGCATTTTPRTIAETAAATPQLSTLTRLVQDAGLTDMLKGPGPYTVFAPSNDAFAALPANTIASLAGDKEKLRAVLAYHVVPGNVTSSTLKNGPAKTAQGAEVSLYKAGSFVTVEEAVVTQPDLIATNGVIHIVDRVMLPPVR
jgi:uncharacterized surface protein with fasciclin (FAS1) repeats